MSSRAETLLAAVDYRDQHPAGKRRHQMRVARNRFAGQRPGRDRPFDFEAIHFHARSAQARHFLMLTIVPWPGREVISNSSIKRRAPGSPIPRLLPVE